MTSEQTIADYVGRAKERPHKKSTLVTNYVSRTRKYLREGPQVEEQPLSVELEQMADSVRGMRIRVFETDMYSGVPASTRPGYAIAADFNVDLNQGWFAERKRVTRGLGLTQEEADWFVNC